MATRTISVLGGNWGDLTTWAEAAIPTNADDVVATSSSGNLALNVAAACRSLDLDTYVGTLSGTNTITIGDGTAGAGNIALRLASGMTLTATSTFAFVSTSGTTQSVTSNGKTINNSVTFNGAGGSWQLTDHLVTTASVGITNGTFDANDKNVTATTLALSAAGTRTCLMGNGTWTLTGGGRTGPVLIANTTNLTFNAENSTIVINIGATNRTFTGGGQTFHNVEVVTGGAGILTFDNNNTFNKFTATGGSTVTVKFTASTTTTLTGGTDAFFSGAASNLITIESVTGGSAWNLSKASGNLACDYLSLKDSAASGGATFYAGSHSTDVSGNSGWSFTDAPAGQPIVKRMGGIIGNTGFAGRLQGVRGW